VINIIVVNLKKRRLLPKHYQHHDKYGDWLGYKIKKIDKKRLEAKVELKIRKDHLSISGRVHGGVVSGFFDSACGMAVFTCMGPEDFCSTVELKVNYFHPIHYGDILLCHSKVVFRGKRLCVVHGLLYRQQEKQPLAMATATFYMITSKKNKK